MKSLALWVFVLGSWCGDALAGILEAEAVAEPQAVQEVEIDWTGNSKQGKLVLEQLASKFIL